MITLNCHHCNCTFVSATPAKGQSLEDFLTNWKAVARINEDVYHCVPCGGRFRVEDDGVDVSLGGSVKLVNVSAPRLDSLSITGGARTGGEALYVLGAALDLDGLVVKFGGKPVQSISNQAHDRARIVTPIGQYKLNVDEALSGTFIVGEQVRGVNSGALGVVRSLAPLVIDRPTRAFDLNEEVHGDASGAKVRLGNPPYSGAVDVSVENENGQRPVGGVIVDGFTYL